MAVSFEKIYRAAVNAAADIVPPEDLQGVFWIPGVVVTRAYTALGGAVAWKDVEAAINADIWQLRDDVFEEWDERKHRLADDILREAARFNASAFSQRAALDDAAKAFEDSHAWEDITSAKARVWFFLTEIIEKTDALPLFLLNVRTLEAERITRGGFRQRFGVDYDDFRARGDTLPDLLDFDDENDLRETIDDLKQQ